MIKAPIISVIIATFNRCDTLKVTLDKLAKQIICPEDFEVLVIDDGSSDSTQEMVESHIALLPYNLRFFRHENRGPGYTQNRGIREAVSKLILLMADDVWTTPGMLQQHLKTHTEYPDENIAVLGKVIQSPELPSTVMHKYWDPFRYDILDGKRQLDAIHFLACNISVKKKFMIENGMYKERKGAAHEDIELGYRLGQRGMRILYNSDAVACHYHPETLSGACRRAYERGRNFNMLSQNIPKELIFPAYKMCTIEAGVAAFLKMLPREIIRRCLFNEWSVNRFWLTVLERAEHSRTAALFANGMSYRGTIYYHMRKGYRDRHKQKAALEAKDVTETVTQV